MHFGVWDSTNIIPTKPALADETSKRMHICHSDSINPSYTPSNVLFLFRILMNDIRIRN